MVFRIDIRFLFLVGAAFLGFLPLEDLANLLIAFYIAMSFVYFVNSDIVNILDSVSKSSFWLGVLSLIKNEILVAIMVFLFSVMLFAIKVLIFDGDDS